ncbi:MAG: winged helix-turn-helix transcriptional regulator [bacterium]
MLTIEKGRWDSRIYLSSIPTAERPWRRALHEDRTRLILSALSSQSAAGVRDISVAVGLSRKIVRNQVKRLVQDGVVATSGGARPRFWATAAAHRGAGGESHTDVAPPTSGQPLAEITPLQPTLPV